ncbi:MAG: hypothetical protein GC172_00925 [Phycisphaera sp.]|nr:hypothetical protein [Phycisphaera sp.]
MQQDAAAALAQFCAFVKARYGLAWDPAQLPSNDPNELRRQLVERAAAIGKAEAESRAAQCLARGRDADSISAWFAEECMVRIGESEREEIATDADGFVRRKLLDLPRLELTAFERWVLLSILDNAWKDNLHSMDQIRDAIGLRAFSQKDPRIEFKRESAKVFNEMQETVRDRVTDIAFRGRLAPQTPRVAPRPAMAAAGAGTGTVAGALAGAAPAADGGADTAARSLPEQRPQQPPAAAERALAAESPVDPASIPVVGRNEPCPCGSGMKYRQCHGKKPEAQE